MTFYSRNSTHIGEAANISIPLVDLLELHEFIADVVVVFEIMA